jgi:hypothetical protein
MHPLKLPLVAVFVALTTGCSEKNPAAPTSPASPTVANLVISGVDAVRTGLFANYTATATLSDGTTRAVTPTWTSSNTGAASVDSAGRLVGVAHGSTNLTASHDGRSASKVVQVVNNYEGAWEGQYVVRACTDSGDLTNRDGGWCRGGPGRVGNVGSIRLALSQTGGNLSDISGTVVGIDEGGNITGMVLADGRLSLVGGPVNTWDWEGTVILATWRIPAWETSLSGPSAMTGRWSQDYASVYFRIGNAKMENELVTMTRTSTSAGPASASP